MSTTPTTTISLPSLLFTLFLTVTFLASSLYILISGLIVPAMTVASAG
ncbi:hypothetical protein KBD59_03270 [Candidatus Gracilibacteria bacterium]|nr:hypothetical protein [Candidatus Gracilibacteria bacterium]